jgi:hypothetical protein
MTQRSVWLCGRWRLVGGAVRSRRGWLVSWCRGLASCLTLSVGNSLMHSPNTSGGSNHHDLAWLVNVSPSRNHGCVNQLGPEGLASWIYSFLPAP